MVNAKKAKAMHPISIGINPLNVKRSFRGFSFERQVFGFKKPLLQTVKFDPVTRIGKAHLPGLLSLKIIDPIKKTIVSTLSCPIDSFKVKGETKRLKVATLFWTSTQERYKGKGLASQLTTEAMHLFKKIGVTKVEAFVTNSHERTILKQLGFKLTSITPEGENYIKEFK